MHVCLLMPCGHLLGRADLLVLVCDVYLWRCHFPIGILGQVWYFVVLIPDHCPLSYYFSWFDTVCNIVTRWVNFWKNSCINMNNNYLTTIFRSDFCPNVLCIWLTCLSTKMNLPGDTGSPLICCFLALVLCVFEVAPNLVAPGRGGRRRWFICRTGLDIYVSVAMDTSLITVNRCRLTTVLLYWSLN